MAALMKLEQRKPLRLHHPCSGKHMMMLAACQRFGYQKDLYWEVDHPLQKKISYLVGREAGEQVRWGKDTCGVPSFYMPIRVHLGMWERFALDAGEKASVLKTLWLQNPRLVGGLGRLDSDLTLAANCKILAKESGNGDLLVQSLGDEHHPPASCLIKIASGSSKVYSALALLVVIRKHPELPPIFHELAEYLHSRLDEWIPRELKLQELL
jgi:L-asparaginase II